jgi:hypothetical protein
MSKKRFLLCLGVVFVYSFLVISCGKKILCDPPPLLESEDLLTASPSNPPTDVFIDATLSMQGFVGDGASSYYQQSIPMLERAVIKNGGKISFYKFGTDIQPLPERSYEDAEKKGFYSDSSINKKTLIEKVIDRADPHSLTIIVTDLFQERADINQLSEKISAKFIKNNQAVGVLGIRSQFNGKIFDVGPNNYSFVYTSAAEPKSLRPFYLLALGTHADIAHYFETLTSGEMSSFPETQKVIFSKFVSTSPATWAHSTIIDSRGINEVNGVLVAPQKGETPYKEFKVKNNVETATISAQIPYQAVKDTVAYEGLKPTVEAFTCGAAAKTSDNSSASTGNIPNPEGGAVQFSAATSDAGRIDLKIDIAPKKLDSKIICGYHLIVRPGEYHLPSWINEWNMTGEQIESWHRTPQSFDGSRTYNLSPFLGTLWEINRQINNPKIADFYTYFRAG